MQLKNIKKERRTMKKHTFKMLTAAFLAGTMLLASTGCSNKPVSSAPSSAAAAGGESAAAPASSGGKVTIRIGGGQVPVQTIQLLPALEI